MVGVFKPEMKLPESTTAMLIGPGMHAPGMADLMRKTVQRLWRDGTVPIVVDASALDLVAPGVMSKTLRVITPHPGEAARMLNSTSKQVQADRPRALRELSKRYGNCWVVLKGHQTLIGRGEGEIFVNPSGNPYMGQGGSGDVLGGYIAGLLARICCYGVSSSLFSFCRLQRLQELADTAGKRKGLGRGGFGAELGNAR